MLCEVDWGNDCAMRGLSRVRSRSSVQYSTVQSSTLRCRFFHFDRQQLIIMHMNGCVIRKVNERLNE